MGDYARVAAKAMLIRQFKDRDRRVSDGHLGQKHNTIFNHIFLGLLCPVSLTTIKPNTIANLQGRGFPYLLNTHATGPECCHTSYLSNDVRQ